jgi:hypothetical protein
MMSDLSNRFSAQLVPRHRLFPDVWYFPTNETLSIGDVLEERSDNIYVAWPSIEAAIFAQGFDQAIYAVKGTPYSGPRGSDYLWGGDYGSPLKDNLVFPNGGYRDIFGTDDFYILAKSFDDLQVLDVITDQAFGPNGHQVIVALKWWRSKFMVDNRDDSLVPRPQYRVAIKSVHRYYATRVQKQHWNRASMRNDIALRAATKEGLITPSLRLWLKPWQIAGAWNRAIEAAESATRLAQCSWLGLDSPALAALALRDVISPSDFALLYAGLDPLLPLTELDAAAAPVVHGSSTDTATYAYEYALNEAHIACTSTVLLKQSEVDSAQPRLKGEKELHSTDVPTCLRAFRIALSENAFAQGRSDQLASPKLTGRLSNADPSEAAELRRVYRCADWTCRTILPVLLRETDERDLASAIEQLAPISDLKSVRAAALLFDNIEASGEPVSAMAIGSAGGTLTSAELCAASPYGDPVDFAQADGDVDAVEAASIAARAAAVRVRPRTRRRGLAPVQ